MPVVQESVRHGANGDRVAEEFAPVFHWSVGGQHGAGALVPAHDDLEQFIGGERQLPHAQVVDDEQRHGLQELHVLFARAVERSLGASR